jgi:hypothetical protein
MTISWASNPPYPEVLPGAGDWSCRDEVMGVFLSWGYRARNRDRLQLDPGALEYRSNRWWRACSGTLDRRPRCAGHIDHDRGTARPRRSSRS